MIKRYRFFFIYFTLSLFSLFTIHANKPNHTSKFYINDFANILDQETKDYIYSQSKALNNKTSIQLVVTTVESIGNETIETFANELFRFWGIGDKEKNNGLLILLALNERKIRMEVGYGLEDIMNDAKAGRFLRTYATPYLSKNEFSKGILSLYKATLNEITLKNQQSSTNQNHNKENKKNIFSRLTANDIISYIHFSLIIVFIIIFIKQTISGPPGGSDRGSDGESTGSDNSNDNDSFSDGGNFYGGGGSSGGGGDFGGGGSSGGGGASSGF